MALALRETGFELRVEDDGGGFSTAELVRSIPRLIADVTDFMTLIPGDVLLVGLSNDSPRARIGDVVRADVLGLGWVETRLVAEGGR